MKKYVLFFIVLLFSLLLSTSCTRKSDNTIQNPTDINQNNSANTTPQNPNSNSQVNNSNANKQDANTQTSNQDYLPAGTVFAAFGWEDAGFTEMALYPAQILTQASEKTKNQYEVISLKGSSDVSKGTKYWTKNVILKSHPANKNEIKVGMIVLATNNYTSPDGNVKKALANAIWAKYVVLDTSDLFKDMVKLGFIGDISKQEIVRKSNFPVKALRISDEPNLGSIQLK